MMAEPSSRKPWWRRWFGSRSERAAGRYLRRAGFRVVAWNVNTPYGEIDLVALDGKTVVFVEVRSTESEDSSRPAESVDERKQRKLTDSALDFLRRRDLLEHPARFDVLILSWPPGRREPDVEHHRQAFEAVGRWQTFS
jgi:putative endonuclease